MPGIPTMACVSKLSDWENSPPRSLLPKTITGITGKFAMLAFEIVKKHVDNVKRATQPISVNSIIM